MSRSGAAARRLLLRRLIAKGGISSQHQIVRLLARHGHRATQATISRDLAALGIVKVPGPDEDDAYALSPASGGRAPERAELKLMLRTFALEIEHSRNLVVVKTPPGGAGPVASALDRERLPGVLGTVAGDDTVLVVMQSDHGGARLVHELQSLLGG